MREEREGRGKWRVAANCKGKSRKWRGRGRERDNQRAMGRGRELGWRVGIGNSVREMEE